MIQALILWTFSLPLYLHTQTYQIASANSNGLYATSIFIYKTQNDNKTKTKTWRLTIIHVECALRIWFWCSVGDLPEQAGPLKYFYTSVMYDSVMALLERATLIFFIPATGTLEATLDNRVVENIMAQRLAKNTDFLIIIKDLALGNDSRWIFFNYMRLMWQDHWAFLKCLWCASLK